jgi:integrase
MGGAVATCCNQLRTIIYSMAGLKAGLKNGGQPAMAMKARELTAIEVKRLVHTGRGNKTFSVGGVAGLLLQIKPTGTKSWILRTVVGEKRRELGLGPYPDVPLAHARERAREAKEQIWQGIDPIERKRAAQAGLRSAQSRGLTFGDAVERYLRTRLAEFRNDKHKKQWRSTLDTYAAPVLGAMLVSEIDVTDIVRTLEPIWVTKTETASRLRGRIESVLAWATVSGHRQGDNPARWRGNLDAVLAKPTKITKVTHHPALSLTDAASWFADLLTRSGSATRALEFAVVTAARSGEIRGATWDEIDLNTKLWTVSADRMKAGKEHRVPLTDEAVKLLEGLDRFEGVPYVFPGVRGGQLSDASLSACMKRIQAEKPDAYLDQRSGRPAVPHGLRSTFRDWAAEHTTYPREMAEIALAHTVGSEVERAYRRGDMVEKRRAMMAAWGRFLRDEASVQVVKLGATS